MPKQKYTLADVASEAGVSVMTVSRVVNNKGEISEKTRQQVQSVIDRMQYRPNRAARSLVTQRTYAIGIVVPDITNPFFARIVRGIEDEAWKHGYNILLNNTVEQRRREEAALQLMVEADVEGLVLCSPRLPDKRLRQLLKSHRAVVTINRAIPQDWGHNVLIENDSLLLQIEYMLSAGYNRLILLHHDSQRPRDLKALQQLQNSLGDKVTFHRFDSGLPTYEYGYDWMQTHFAALRESVNGVICSNDLIAHGVIQAAKEMGLSLPGQLAVIGTDDIPSSKLINPSLTTLESPQYDMGRAAMQILLKDFDEAFEMTCPTSFQYKMVIRDSA